MALKTNVRLVQKYLNDNDWHVERDDHEDKTVFTGGIGGLGGIFDSFRFMLVVEEDVVQNFGMLPFSAPEKVSELAEFAHRANYGMRFGKFELDYDKGSVRFHVILPIVAVEKDTNESMDAILGIPAAMIKKYASGFVNVYMGAKSPRDAIAECEK